MEHNYQVDPSRFRTAVELGLRVFPLRPQGKEPAIPWKEFQHRSPSEDEVELWGRSPFNVGIVCGADSGVVVLDVDSPEAQQLVDGLDLPPTPIVRTARGAHYYFGYPGFEVRNGVRIGGAKLDIRGDGGYVVGPGSIHPDGPFYSWIVSPTDVPFAPFPDALLKLIGESKPSSTRCSKASTVDRAGSTSRFGGWLTNHLADAKGDIAKMEEGKEHRVALSSAAVELLQALPRKDDFIFPGLKRGKSLSNMAMENLLRRMNAKPFTVHGFRSSFRDWCAEETEFPRDLAELALAHAVGSEVERAYRRSDGLERRRGLMDAWATYLIAPTYPTFNPTTDVG